MMSWRLVTELRLGLSRDLKLSAGEVLGYLISLDLNLSLKLSAPDD